MSVRIHRREFRLGLVWYRFGIIVRIGPRFRVFGKREHGYHCEELGICICRR